MDRDRNALSPQAVVRETGIGSPGFIDEFGRAVSAISRHDCRDRVDRYLKLAFGLPCALFRPQPFGVLGMQRFILLFELSHRRLQIITRAPERFLRAPLRYAKPNHEKRGHRKKSEAR